MPRGGEAAQRRSVRIGHLTPTSKLLSGIHGTVDSPPRLGLFGALRDAAVKPLMFVLRA